MFNNIPHKSCSLLTPCSGIKMRQRGGVILEAIYYDVVRTSYACRTPAPTKQMLL